MTKKILTFSNELKKPRKIEGVLPWPPSEGLMKEMEDGKVLGCTFEIPIIIKTRSDNRTQEEVLRDLENRRKL